MATKLESSAIEQAMADAVVLANARGVTEPAVVRSLMQAARERVVKDHEDAEVIRIARLESARANKKG